MFIFMLFSVISTGSAHSDVSGHSHGHPSHFSSHSYRDDDIYLSEKYGALNVEATTLILKEIDRLNRRFDRMERRSGKNRYSSHGSEETYFTDSHSSHKHSPHGHSSAPVQIIVKAGALRSTAAPASQCAGGGVCLIYPGQQQGSPSTQGSNCATCGGVHQHDSPKVVWPVPVQPHIHAHAPQPGVASMKEVRSAPIIRNSIRIGGSSSKSSMKKPVSIPGLVVSDGGSTYSKP